jgi:hypothetical protein
VFTDRAVLRTAAYAGPGPLSARQAIYRWQRDRVDLPGIAIAAGAALPDDVPWEAFLSAVRARVPAEIARTGHWRLGNQIGILVCR